MRVRQKKKSLWIVALLWSVLGIFSRDGHSNAPFDEEIDSLVLRHLVTALLPVIRFAQTCLICHNLGTR
jgi:hypothetical protein